MPRSPLGPEFVGPTSGFFSPTSPAPVLFSCLGCKSPRAIHACRCGYGGCHVCHLRDCSMAAAAAREESRLWRESVDRNPPESRSTRPKAGEDLGLTEQPQRVRKVTLR